MYVEEALSAFWIHILDFGRACGFVCGRVQYTFFFCVCAVVCWLRRARVFSLQERACDPVVALRKCLRHVPPSPSIYLLPIHLRRHAHQQSARIRFGIDAAPRKSRSASLTGTAQSRWRLAGTCAAVLCALCFSILRAYSVFA